MTTYAMLNALREEGTKADCIAMLEKLLTEREALEAQVAEWQRCYDRAQRLRASTESQVAELMSALEEAVRAAESALKPFADRVFNDNGDCTVTDTYRVKAVAFITAYFVHRKLRALASRAPTAAQPMTVIDPNEWEPCSPAYLAAGGSCDAPRVWNAETKNHWHPKLPAPAAAQGGRDEG